MENKNQELKKGKENIQLINLDMMREEEQEEDLEFGLIEGNGTLQSTVTNAVLASYL